MKKWPATEVEMVNLDKVIPYARNSRVNSDEQVAQIASSIQEWGFTVPILMDEGFGLIAGHGRLMAAQRLGLKEIPAMVAKNWTEAQKKAYIIADNKLAMNSTWDEAMLKIEIKELTDLNFDTDLTGFSLDDLASLFDDTEKDYELPDEQEYKETYEVAVICDGEAQQEKMYNELVEKGYKCRILTM